MYINRNPNFVFIDIPKTGTRSVLMALQNNFNGRTMRDHIKEVQPEFRDYYNFTVVRDPYARVISLWWSTCKRDNDNYGFIQSMTDLGLKNELVGFLKMVREMRTDASRHRRVKGYRLNFTTTQSEFITPNRIDSILHTEHLNAEFAELPFWEGKQFKMPNVNTTTNIAKNNPTIRPSVDELLNERSIKLINEIYAVDFELLGYEKR